MPTTGNEFVTSALQELGVLDAIQVAAAEDTAKGLEVGSDMLDAWRLDGLLISGTTINTHSLSDGTASYTIGDGGAFDQTWPTEILRWSVIQDDDAADPVETPIGRPLTSDQWQLVSIKTTEGSYPTKMYFDRLWAAGLGTCYFHPVPDNDDVDVKLYSRLPEILSLVAVTSYDLQPGMARAIKLNLALELARPYGRQVTPDLQASADKALGKIKRANIVPRESRIRSELVLGRRGRSRYDLTTDGY